MSKDNIYVGIDLHKRNFNFIMMKADGEILKEGRLSTSVEDVMEFGSTLNKNHHLVVEPIGNSLWFIGRLTPHAGSIHLANSHKVRLIAESRMKNDRIDARILADLLRVGYLPEVYIPSAETSRWRSMIGHRIRLVRDRTRLKNRVLTLIDREGLKVGLSDAFGRKGRALIDGMELSEGGREMVDNYLVMIDLLTSQIESMEKEIKEIGDNDEIIRYLMTIDGISYFTGLAIRAFVGDMQRFKGPKSFAAYTGLIPGYPFGSVWTGSRRTRCATHR